MSRDQSSAATTYDYIYDDGDTYDEPLLGDGYAPVDSRGRIMSVNEAKVGGEVCVRACQGV